MDLRPTGYVSSALPSGWAILLWAAKTWLEFRLHTNVIFSSGGTCLAPFRKESRLSCITIRDAGARRARLEGSSWAGHTTPGPARWEARRAPQSQLDCFRASPGALPDGQQSGSLANLAWTSALESLVIVLAGTVSQARAQTSESMQRAEMSVSKYRCMLAAPNHLPFCCRSQNSCALVLPHKPASEAVLEMVKNASQDLCSFSHCYRPELPRGS